MDRIKTVLALEKENVDFLHECKEKGLTITYVVNQAIKEYKKMQIN